MKDITEQLRLPMWYEMTNCYIETSTSCDYTFIYAYCHYEPLPFWKDKKRIGALLMLIGMFALPLWGIWYLN